MEAFRYNHNVKYQTGGVYKPTHQFSLVNQSIRVNKKSSFDVRFPSIWDGYKLPPIQYSKDYDNWIANPMQFYQNQLNLSVCAATAGCGISKEHLRHKDPMIRSVYRFHAYYQIRRILHEMECPTPNTAEWEPLDNHINMGAYADICREFGLDTNTDFRQKLDRSFGMGSMLYRGSIMPRDPSDPKHKGKWGKGDWMPNEPRVQFYKEKHDISKKYAVRVFSWHGRLIPIPRYVDQLEQFFRESNNTQVKPDGSQFDAIGSFVLDEGKGFTQAGISRINDSIRTYVWAILGAQSQARTSIIGESRAFDAQKQFLANVETAINSAVDIPESIKRYQDTLGYARSKVDFVVGFDLYMMPSDMDLYIGKINGYNNLLLDASESDTPLVLGYNDEVNDSPPIQTTEASDLPGRVKEEPQQDVDIEENVELQAQVLAVSQDPLTHDERKLLLILGGGAVVSSLIWFWS